VAPEKKLVILSFKDGAAGAGGGVAPADVAAGGTVLVDAVVAGAPAPLHPASNNRVSTVAAGDRWRQPDFGNARCVLLIIANSRSPLAIANSRRLSQDVARLG
jgi:hypothetical protein